MVTLTTEQFEAIEKRKELISDVPFFSPEHAFQLFMLGAKRLSSCKDLGEKDFAAVWFSSKKIKIQNNSKELVL